MNLDDSIQEAATQLTRYSKTLDAESSQYWINHGERFCYITQLFGEILEELQASSSTLERVLDIGNSYQTMMINEVWPQLQIDTMGFFAERYAPNGPTRHYDYDLNDTYFPEKWLAIEEPEKYDIIFFLEVIEHLYTSPKSVLDFLRSILKPGGHLVIQTPNAASLIKRLRLLFGENPYELIRNDRMNPGHFREYTKQEITELANKSGFVVKDLRMTDYFVENTFAEKVCGRVAKILPQTFKTAMTVVLKVR
ncbi:MAG: SAM-dependent methyltransferase [Halioglobus sp.]|jgi:SAM-dependent methyltransferase